MRLADLEHPRSTGERSGVLVLVGLLVLLFSAVARADSSNLLPNGSFQSGTTGWKASNATLTIASDGPDDGFAGRVAKNATATSYQLTAAPRPVLNTSAGVVYTANGLVRSDTPGNSVCLRVKEFTSAGTAVLTRQACVLTSSQWAPLPQVTLTAQHDGDQVAFIVIRTSGALAGESFEVDELSLVSSRADTTAPDPPTDLRVSNVGQSLATLSWTAATDDVGVTSYDLYRDSTKVASVDGSTLSYQFTGLTCATTYTLGVAAGDAAGHRSTLATLSAMTAPCFVGSSTHVVWVVMENRSYEQIIGNTTSAPYLNGLAQQYGSATNMQAELHPSLPNYIAMTSGSTQGITDDLPPASHPLDVENIFHQLPGGASRSLEESMPSSCYQTNSSPYVVRHNPEAYYTNLGSDCAGYDVPLGSAPDLSAAFTFITPNVCHDMHSNSCPGSTNPILQGDQWLQGFVPQLLATPEYQTGSTVVFITWDEGKATTNHIPTLVISPTTSHVQSSTAFTHYSLLRTTEEILGLPLIGGAASAASMRADFNL